MGKKLNDYKPCHGCGSKPRWLNLSKKTFVCRNTTCAFYEISQTKEQWEGPIHPARLRVEIDFLLKVAGG